MTWKFVKFAMISILWFFFEQGVDSTSVCPRHLSKVKKSKSYVHNHVCYLFVDNEKYWNNARDECWNLGGEMLSIENEETMNFIRQKLTKDVGWNRNGVWLGGKFKSGRWIWTNGRPINYNNWAPGEPSRYLGPLSVEDCILMRQDNGWKWSDNVCGTLRFHYNYICQFNLEKPDDKDANISAEAQNHENDNGYSRILTMIIILSFVILFCMLLLFLLLRYRFNKLKLKAAAGSVYFSNSTHHNGVIEGSTVSHPPEPPRNQPPAVIPGHDTYTEVVRPNNHLAHTRPPDSKNRLQDSSLTFLEAMGACGGSDPELGMTTPLMLQERASSSSPDLGQYVDMRSVSSMKGSDDGLKDDKHTYSNVEHKAEENFYEVLP